MVMPSLGRVGLALLAFGSLSACTVDGASTAGGGEGGCVSHYDSVVTAATWQGLQDEILASETWGQVTSLRTQAQGDDVGVGDQDAVRVMDILNRSGVRLAKVEVWRTGARAWRAGAWMQCTD